MLQETLILRELNVVTLYGAGLGGEFTAYLNGNIGLDLVSKIGSMTDITASSAVTAAFNAFGYAPAIDMPRWYSYKGTDPLKFTINCYLKVKEDFNKDVTDPLKLLFKYILPSRGESLANLTPEFVKQFLSGIDLTKGASSFLGSIYILKVPAPLDFKKAAPLNMDIGKNRTIKFQEVIVTKVALQWGKLILDKGYPERVDLAISIETARNATTDLLETIFK